MDWLTEEWARKTHAAAWKKYIDDGRASPIRIHTDEFMSTYIARAAAQNMAKWLFSPCKEHHLNNSTPPLRIDCYICRKDMEEVRL